MKDRAIISNFLQSHFQNTDGSSYRYTFEIGSAHCAQALFPNWELRWIEAEEPYLPIPRLPSSRTSGLFAYNQEDCLFLCKRYPKNLSRLLQSADLHFLEGGDPKPLERIVQLFCDALLTDGARGQIPVGSMEDLERLPVPTGFPPYKTNPREIERLALELKGASYTPCSDGGGRFDFLTVSGWMHNKTTLLQHSIVVTHDHEVQHEEKELSRNIFSAIPMIRY